MLRGLIKIMLGNLYKYDSTVDKFDFNRLTLPTDLGLFKSALVLVAGGLDFPLLFSTAVTSSVTVFLGTGFNVTPQGVDVF